MRQPRASRAEPMSSLRTRSSPVGTFKLRHRAFGKVGHSSLVGLMEVLYVCRGGHAAYLDRHQW